MIFVDYLLVFFKCILSAVTAGLHSIAGWESIHLSLTQTQHPEQDAAPVLGRQTNYSEEDRKEGGRVHHCS